MSLVRRNNAVSFPSLLDEILKPDWFGGIENLNTTVPAVNIKETENDFTIELAAPGKKKEDFNIEVNENTLTISSEVKTEKEDKADGGKYTRREFKYSSFKRAFTLPETVSEDKINASYEDGVLKLALPKKEEALPKPKRLIEIA
jgi:HSP20 family protein